MMMMIYITGPAMKKKIKRDCPFDQAQTHIAQHFRFQFRYSDAIYFFSFLVGTGILDINIQFDSFPIYICDCPFLISISFSFFFIKYTVHTHTDHWYIGTLNWQFFFRFITFFYQLRLFYLSIGVCVCVCVGLGAAFEVIHICLFVCLLAVCVLS